MLRDLLQQRVDPPKAHLEITERVPPWPPELFEPSKFQPGALGSSELTVSFSMWMTKHLDMAFERA
jgi:hypothetical protein